MSSWILYVHKFPNNKLYFGITHNKLAKERWRYGRGYESQTLMNRAIQKYGWNNIQHIVLMKGLSKEVACECEKYSIAKYGTQNPLKGYNVYAGGDCGSFGYVKSEETRRKISEGNKGKKMSPESIRKQKISVQKFWTKERRKEFGKLYGGHGFLLDTELALQAFNELCDGADRKELARHYNISKSAMDAIANKRYWSIRNSKHPILQRKLPQKFIYQYTLDGSFIKKWNTFQQIHDELHINTATLCECCNHKRVRSKGYIWNYVLILDNGEEITL